MENLLITIFMYVKKKCRMISYLFLLLLFMNIASCFFKFVAGHPHVYGFVPQFEFDSENNIPTYFSSIILLISAFLLKIIAVFKKSKKDIFYKRWSLLSIIFLFLSVDESASLHELFIFPLRKIFKLSGAFYYSWVIVGIAVVLILSVYYYKFLLDLPSRVRFQFLLAAFFFVGGAIGIEMIGGYYSDVYTDDNLTYAIITTIEESFEMIGVIIFINSLLQYIEKIISNFNFELKSKENPK